VVGPRPLVVGPFTLSQNIFVRGSALFALSGLAPRLAVPKACPQGFILAPLRGFLAGPLPLRKALVAVLGLNFVSAE
jgi:hypothetical protein